MKMHLLKDTLKAFDDFKNKQHVWSNVFWYVKVYILTESLFITISIEIKHKC